MKRDKLDSKVLLVEKGILMIKVGLHIQKLTNQVLVKLYLSRKMTDPIKRE